MLRVRAEHAKRALRGRCEFAGQRGARVIAYAEAANSHWARMNGRHSEHAAGVSSIDAQ